MLPDYCCIVPEKREELTTEGGLNVKKNSKYLKQFVKEIKDIRDESRELVQVAEQIHDMKDPKDQQNLVAEIEKKMHEAADNLEFELAAVLRDQLNELTQSHSKK